MISQPSKIFTSEVVVVGSFKPKSTNLSNISDCKDASQFYPYPMCQLLPTGLYFIWE